MKVIRVSNWGRAFDVRAVLVVADDYAEGMVETLKGNLEDAFRVTAHDVVPPAEVFDVLAEPTK
jgi:hypothetical protein